jgi:arylsulfatase
MNRSKKISGPSQIFWRKFHFFLWLSVVNGLWLYALAVLWVAPDCRAANPPRAATDRPNLIIVFCDDAGYADFSITGHPTIRTPSLERMARQGLVFSQFYCASGACSASRYALLTGRNAHRSGLGSWVLAPTDARYIHQNEVTIADGLRQLGYATAIHGKWHLGTPNAANGNNTNAFPLAHGFDQYYGLNASADYNDVTLYQGPSSTPNFAGVYQLLSSDVRSNATLQANFTGTFTDKTIAFIHTNKAKPFFIYNAFTLPHLPLYPNGAFTGHSYRGTYGDIIEEIDYSLGRILDALVADGIDQNTIVMFASDNGPWIYYYSDGIQHLNVGNAGPYRDGKGSGWEGAVRVPGVFWWPGTIAAGSVVNQPVSTLDVLPTIFHIAGEPLPTGRTIDGRDISPLLAPALYTNSVPPFEYYYVNANNVVSGVRKGDWKLHVQIYSQLNKNYGYNNVTFANPILFNLAQDIGERFNVVSSQTSVVTNLQSDITNFNNQVSSEGTFWGPP